MATITETLAVLRRPYHRDFGRAASDGAVEMWTNCYGRTYVGAYWGPWRIYAALPAEEVVIPGPSGMVLPEPTDA